MSELGEIRERYRRFAEAECRGYSDVYYRLALATSDDDAILRFIAERPAVQPNLFFAAVQYVTGPLGMPTTAAELGQLLDRRGGEVAELMRTRRTQTNEVGRCAVLLPALPSVPLALIEVGASAGLCLLLDRFFYDYGSAQAGDFNLLEPIHRASWRATWWTIFRSSWPRRRATPGSSSSTPPRSLT